MKTVRVLLFISTTIAVAGCKNTNSMLDDGLREIQVFSSSPYTIRASELFELEGFATLTPSESAPLRSIRKAVFSNGKFIILDNRTDFQNLYVFDEKTGIFLNKMRFTIIMGLGVLFLNLYRWLNDLRFYGFWFPLALSAVCSILIASAHIWRVRNAENSSKNGIVDYSVRQTLELNIPKTPQQLFDELRGALRMREWELADSDKISGKMKFETKGSLFSSGEIVAISIAAEGNGWSRVEVVSKPILGFASVDFRKNKLNVNLIARILGM